MVSREIRRVAEPEAALVRACYEKITKWAAAAGVRVFNKPLDAGKAGKFDGIGVTMNDAYPTEERLFYLAHAMGSIVLWSTELPVIQSMFDELRHAKKRKQSDSDRFERALKRYRQFENHSSELAVSLLGELGCSELVVSFSNFMRADLESMTEFHRTGRAPVWASFLHRWNREVERGERKVRVFEPRQMPAFKVRQIEKQEILQQQAVSREAAE